MKDANRVVKDCVLRSISDDYENAERILEEVAVWAAQKGVTPERNAVLKALEELIRDGYAQAFVFEYPFRKAIPTDYSRESADSLWFYVTPAGKQLAYELQGEWR